MPPSQLRGGEGVGEVSVHQGTTLAEHPLLRLSPQCLYQGPSLLSLGLTGPALGRLSPELLPCSSSRKQKFLLIHKVHLDAEAGAGEEQLPANPTKNSLGVAHACLELVAIQLPLPLKKWS